MDDPDDQKAFENRHLWMMCLFRNVIFHSHVAVSEHAVDFPTRDSSVCIFCSKACLDHAWLVNVKIFSLFEQLRRPSLPFPFWLSCSQLNKIAAQTTDWQDRVYTSLCAFLYEIWGPGLCDLGPFLGSVLGFIFGPCFGARDCVFNCRGPKQGPKLDPIRFQKHNPERKICTKTRTRTCRHDLQSGVCAAILFNCEQLQPKRKET